MFGEQETSSYYGPLNVVALNVGHHNEHHDFPSVPWNRLPAIRRAVPEVYDALSSHRSWTRLLVRSFSTAGSRCSAGRSAPSAGRKPSPWADRPQPEISAGTGPDTTGSGARWRPHGMDTRLAAAIGVTFGALLLLVSVTWVNTSRLIEDARLVDHTKDVIGELEGAFSAIKDGETSQRGFLLTGSDSYLDPYRAAVADLPRRLERIAALTADSPAQRTRAAMLRHLTEDRLSEMSRTIEMAQGGHEEEARAFLKTGVGKRTMDAIRQLVVEMKAEERALLSIRDRRSSETARTLLTTLGIGCVPPVRLPDPHLVSHSRRRHAAQQRRSRDP